MPKDIKIVFYLVIYSLHKYFKIMTTYDETYKGTKVQVTRVITLALVIKDKYIIVGTTKKPLHF